MSRASHSSHACNRPPLQAAKPNHVMWSPNSTCFCKGAVFHDLHSSKRRLCTLIPFPSEHLGCTRTLVTVAAGDTRNAERGAGLPFAAVARGAGAAGFCFFACREQRAKLPFRKVLTYSLLQKRQQLDESIAALKEASFITRTTLIFSMVF